MAGAGGTVVDGRHHRHHWHAPGAACLPVHPPDAPPPALPAQELVRAFADRPRDFMPLHLAHFHGMCRLVLSRADILAQLRAAAYDAIVSDNTFQCGFVLADLLGLRRIDLSPVSPQTHRSGGADAMPPTRPCPFSTPAPALSRSWHADAHRRPFLEPVPRPVLLARPAPVHRIRPGGANGAAQNRGPPATQVPPALPTPHTLPPLPTPPQTFVERAISELLSPLVFQFGSRLALQSARRLASEFNLTQPGSMAEAHAKAVLLLVNEGPGLGTPRSLPPTVQARVRRGPLWHGQAQVEVPPRHAHHAAACSDGWQLTLP